jgi:hypothetical protein
MNGGRFVCCRVKLLAVLAAACPLIRPLEGFGQQPTEALKQRLLAEAPARWEEYARRSEELQGVVSLVSTNTRNNFRQDTRTAYKTNGRSRLVITKLKDEANGKVEREYEEVFGYNPRYAFTLSRKSPDAPWVLTNYVEMREGVDLGQMGRRQSTSYFGVVNKPVKFHMYFLVDLVRDSGFRIGECRQVQVDGRNLVEVAFTYNFTENNWKSNWKGKLLLDPERYWCCHSVDGVLKGDYVGGTLKHRNTQSDNAEDGLPLSRAWEYVGDWRSSNGEVTNRQTLKCEAQLSRPDTLPDDAEFTLSAFGLPEPVGVTWEKPSRTYLWILAAAGVSVALALGFRYLARRRAAQAA